MAYIHGLSVFGECAGMLKVKAGNPGISITEISKILGQKWKEANAETRAPFEEAAAKDKARYKEEMAAYKTSMAGADNASNHSH